MYLVMLQTFPRKITGDVYLRLCRNMSHTSLHVITRHHLDSLALSFFRSFMAASCSGDIDIAEGVFPVMAVFPRIVPRWDWEGVSSSSGKSASSSPSDCVPVVSVIYNSKFEY